MKKNAQLMLVFIFVDDFTNGRKLAEKLQAKTMDGFVFKSPEDVIKHVRKESGEQGMVMVCSLETFTEAANEQKIDLEQFWTSYVYTEKGW